MSASLLWIGSVKLITMLSPFLFVLVSIVYAQEIIGVIRFAVLGWRNRRGY